MKILIMQISVADSEVRSEKREVRETLGVSLRAFDEVPLVAPPLFVFVRYLHQGPHDLY